MSINIKYQKGMTLMELLVAGLISIIASSAMIILMANTLGTGTRTIKTTRVADEMRSAMQFMTRELRRANYHSTFSACFGNPDCTGTAGLNIDTYINSVANANGIGIADTGFSTNDCLWFWYDRSLTKTFGATEGTNEPVAAFRRAENDDGVGIIQMTVLEAAAPACTEVYGANGSKWVDLTNPNLLDVTTLEIDNNIATSTDYDTRILYAFLDSDTVNSYLLDLSGSRLAVERIGITMTGTMVATASPGWLADAPPSIVLQDFIRVRNNTISLLLPPPVI